MYTLKNEIEFALINGFDIDEINQNSDYNFLHQAILTNNDKLVKWLIELGADVNIPTSFYATPFHLAIQNRASNVIKTLLKAGTKVNKLDVDGFPPLHYALENKDIDIIKVVLDSGMNIDQVFNDGNTLLTYACRRDYFELTKLLLKAGANPNKEGFHGITPIFYAVGENIPLLINAGADLNKISDSGESIFSTLFRSLPDTKKLLEAGADISIAPNSMNGLVKMLESDTPNTETVKDGKEYLLNLALKYGHTKSVKLLLDAGVHVYPETLQKATIPEHIELLNAKLEETHLTQPSNHITHITTQNPFSHSTSIINVRTMG